MKKEKYVGLISSHLAEEELIRKIVFLKKKPTYLRLDAGAPVMHSVLVYF